VEKDLHYYGTLAIAIAAGIPRTDAEIIAYASQFVDDANGTDSKEHEDHGLLYAITTAHHPYQFFMDKVYSKMEGTEEQRKIWVPFHFLPGGEGTTLSEKLLCVKDGGIAREMLENHLQIALKKPYGLELMGITAHVYMDTFSHYGFSGIDSSFNNLNISSVTLTREPKTGEYIREKFKRFIEKHLSSAAQGSSKCLGHIGAATYPDRPYLQWRFDFVRPRPGNGVTSVRDNQACYFEGCQRLHAFFSRFAHANYAKTDTYRDFADIEADVRELLAFDAKEDVRAKAWQDSGLIDGCAVYNPVDWEKGKEMFSRFATSQDGISTNTYRFHQAAAYHRYYVLKDLLPAHGIAVY